MKKKTTPPSLYRSSLNAAEALDFKIALSTEGLDNEVALLRLQIKSLLAQNEALTLKELTIATNALSRLVVARYHISKSDKKSIKEAIGNVLRDIAMPLGFNKSQVSLSIFKK